MKLKLTSAGGSCASLALSSLLLLLISIQLAGAEPEALERVKRQSTRARQESRVSVESTSAVSSSSSSAATPSLDASVSSQPPGGIIKTDQRPGNVRPQEVTDELDGELARPINRRRPKVPRRRLPAERPDRGDEEDEMVDEDCGDDYEDYHGRGSFEPIRHFKSMFNSMFDQVAPLYERYDGPSMRSPGGRGSMAAAAASSFSSGSDGYSRQSSSVTNNGRTRGIFSETRNGRTKTRRFGDSAGEDEDDS